MQAPVITTERLRLRPYRMSDMDAFWAFFQTSRAEFLDVPKNRTHLWYGFASEVGSWDLQGQGGWAIETEDGELAGQVAITQPPHFPERELGWILFESFEGKGIAYEAAAAARDYAFDKIGVETLVSYVDPQNTRSIALAKRLGAFQDPDAKTFAPGDLVFRHPHPSERDGNVEAYA